MNALEMALEALTNPSTIAVSHAIELIRAELAKPEQDKLLVDLIQEQRAEIDRLRQALAQPEHGFDRTASHMAGEYVDTAGTEHQFKYVAYGLRADENGKLSIGELPKREWVCKNCGEQNVD